MAYGGLDSIQSQKYPNFKNRLRYVFLEYLTRIHIPCVPAARLPYPPILAFFSDMILFNYCRSHRCMASTMNAYQSESI
jgi:hypothetical protein